MPEATDAAEPLEEPPGVRSVSHGLRVPLGWEAANSVVTVLPRMTAPASRKAATAAESRPPCQPLNNGEPCSVTISAVSMMSLMPMGMPSIRERVLPDFQRSSAALASSRARSGLVASKALGVSGPPANPDVAAK